MLSDSSAAHPYQLVSSGSNRSVLTIDDDSVGKQIFSCVNRVDLGLQENVSDIPSDTFNDQINQLRAREDFVRFPLA